MDNTPMNLFYDNIPNDDTDYDNMCGICHENLNTDQTYTLPECNHKYHSNCIITWFRNGYHNCPHCNNTPVSNDNFYSTRRISLPILKAFAKKNNSPKILSKYIKQLDDIKKKEANLKKEKSEFMKNEKNDTPRNMMKQYHKYHTKIGSLRRRRFNILTQIHSLPIKTIVIPKIKIIKK